MVVVLLCVVVVVVVVVGGGGVGVVACSGGFVRKFRKCWSAYTEFH